MYAILVNKYRDKDSLIEIFDSKKELLEWIDKVYDDLYHKMIIIQEEYD